MELWEDQWVKMEEFLNKEALKAQENVHSWRGVSWNRFGREYLDGVAVGLRRATSIVEAFRVSMPKTELEQKVEEMREFSIDEEW